VIEDNREKVELMAKTLLEWETIDADQINTSWKASTAPANREAPSPAPRSPPRQRCCNDDAGTGSVGFCEE